MLNQLKPAKGSRRSSKRVGRGNGSGRGTTCGKGTKGQQSRAGKGRRFGFAGGEKPLLLRQPKLGGFRNPNRKEFEVINLSDLENIPAGSYDISALRNADVTATKKPVKLLGKGKISGKYSLTLNAASKSAKEAIEKAGGSVKIDN